jgi:hypothetical protein
VRRLVIGCLAVLLVGQQAVAASTPPPGDSRAVGPAGYAAERLNRASFEPGSVPTESSGPKVALSRHGVFHLYAGTVYSHRFGGPDDFVPAAVEWRSLNSTAFAASGSGDFIATASTLATSPTTLGVDLQTVGLRATVASQRTRVEVPRIAGASVRLQAAAAGDDVYLVLVQSGADVTSALLLHSPDRGTTWLPAQDLISAAGLADDETVSATLAAEGSVIAVVVRTEDGLHPIAGTVLTSSDRGATWASPVVVDGLDPAAEVDDLRGPASVATDGSSVRVAWLRRGADDPAPSLLTAVTDLGADGWSDAAAVPTAPSTMTGDVDTEVALAALGTTYAAQVSGGRLFSLDPDGTWRWPLPFEPTDVDSTCAPNCPTLLPAAMYGDRLVHRGYGYFSSWFIDHTPARMQIEQNPEKVLDRDDTVVLAFDDDGAIDTAHSSCRYDGRERRFTTYPVRCSGPASARGGSHELVATVVDLAGNTATYRHRWQTFARVGIRWQERPAHWAMPGRARYSWDIDDSFGPTRKLTFGVKTFGRGGDGTRDLPTTASSRIFRLRPGRTTCVNIVASGRAFTGRGSTCSSAARSDTDLTEGGQVVRGTRYTGSTARSLERGRPVLASSGHSGMVSTWAFRVLTCPTCGSLRVADVLEHRVLDLRSPRTRMRILTVHWRHHLSADPAQLSVDREGRVVIDDYWNE